MIKKTNLNYSKIKANIKELYLKHIDYYNIEYYKYKKGLKLIIYPKRSYYMDNGLRNTMLPYLRCKINKNKKHVCIKYRFGLNEMQDTLFRVITIFSYSAFAISACYVILQGNIDSVWKMMVFLFMVCLFDFYVRGCNTQEKRDMLEILTELEK